MSDYAELLQQEAAIERLTAERDALQARLDAMVPLTDERIMALSDNYHTGRAQGDYDFARAIEAAHKIKGTQP